MAAANLDQTGLVANAQFDPYKEAHNVGERWREWLRNFNYYIDGVIGLSQKQKISRLLHQAGYYVQEVYENIKETNDDYAAVERKLTDYFIPTVNVAYERQKFRGLRCTENETIEQFVFRLRIASRYCGYNQVDEEIRDHVIEHCPYNDLKRKLLRKGGDLTLKELLEISRIFQIENPQIQVTEEINAINKSSSNKGCFRCGKTGHFANSSECPALNSFCKKCFLKGHFKKYCKTKMYAGKREPKPEKKRKRKVIKYVVEEESSSEESGEESDTGEESEIHTVFNIKSVQNNKFRIAVNGVLCDFIVDSGAAVNIIDRDKLKELRNKGMKFSLSNDNNKYCTYGGTILPSLGVFNCTINCPDTKVTLDDVTVLVYDGKGPCLLSKDTSERLQLLRVGPYIMSVSKETILQQFKPLFTGIGKLKDYKLKIHLDPNIQLVAQPVRRVPFNMRDIEVKLIKELLDNDIIEPVSGPTPCVSPSHIVRKKEPGQYRLVVDMRRANEAVLRERVPLPTFEELLADLNGCKYFSALDIKWGFHQIELSEESRVITVFSSSQGLFRYKRLFFGIRCAPEIFQRVISQLLSGIDGVANSQDDIIIGGRTQEEHDNRLLQVLNKLQEKGITLNEKKCIFGAAEMTFLGHHLSADGVKPTRTSQEVIQECRAPTTKEEVRSFLGLVNFSARFIPDFSTITEPLRRLTRKDTAFKWDYEQQRAFQQLKDYIVTAPALGFYDKLAETFVITDASPVGIAAVLVQQQLVKGQKQPVIIKYASRALTETEKRYSQTEKEALAIVWACEYLYMYLMGKSFNVVSDHKPLEAIYSRKSSTPSARIQRWVLRLQPFQFKVIYKPGKNNIADPISRLLNLETGKLKTEYKQDIEDSDLIATICENIQAVSVETVRQETLKDEHLEKLKQAIREDRWPKEFKKYEIIKTELCEIDDIVLRGSRIVIPKNLIPKILEIGHEGHISSQGMKAKLRRSVWWVTMAKDIDYYIDTCDGCRLVRTQLPPEPIQSTELPSRVWQLVAMDHLGPLPSGDYLLLIIDYYSRYYEVDIVKRPTAENTIKFLKVMIAREGVMDTLLCDNGPAFRDNDFKNFLQSHGIELRHTTPLWPQANGEVERQNRSILRRLRVAQATGKDWKEELLTYLSAYRTTPHSTTGIPPGELFRGRKIKTKLPELQLEENTTWEKEEELRDKDRFKKQMNKEYADNRRHAKESDLAPGDKVLVRQPKLNKLTTPFAPTEHTVLWKKGNSVVAESSDGKIVRRNSTQFQRINKRDMGKFGQTDGKRKEGEQDRTGELLDQTAHQPDKTSLTLDMTNTSDMTARSDNTDNVNSPRHIVRNETKPGRVRVMPAKYKDFVLGLILDCINK